MRPTIELELIDVPSIFPLSKDKGLPDRGHTTWFKTQSDWYENANYEGYAIRIDEGQPVVIDPTDPADEPLPISGLVQIIWEEMQDPGWNVPQYTITHNSAPPSSLTIEQARLVDDANLYLICRHEEIADEGGVWEQKDTSAVLDLMLQALGSSWDEFVRDWSEYF